MKKCIRLVVPVFFLALALPSTAAAQMGLFGGAAATIPSGDFGDYADTGWQVYAGLLFPVGEDGLWVAGEAFYGQNSHGDTDGDSTNPYGAMGLVGYNLHAPDASGLFVFGGAGILFHKYNSDLFDGETDSAFAYQAGAGYDIVTGGTYGFHVFGSYTGGDTQFISIGAGIGLSLGGSGM